jgi:hypothetical protein
MDDGDSRCHRSGMVEIITETSTGYSEREQINDIRDAKN